jgi:hypothetical protein
MNGYRKDVWNAVDPALPEQAQVMRTIKREPVGNDVFLRQVDFVKAHLELDDKSELIAN